MTGLILKYDILKFNIRSYGDFCFSHLKKKKDGLKFFNNNFNFTINLFLPLGIDDHTKLKLGSLQKEETSLHCEIRSPFEATYS